MSIQSHEDLVSENSALREERDSARRELEGVRHNLVHSQDEVERLKSIVGSRGDVKTEAERRIAAERRADAALAERDAAERRALTNSGATRDLEAFSRANDRLQAEVGQLQGRLAELGEDNRRLKGLVGDERDLKTETDRRKKAEAERDAASREAAAAVAVSNKLERELDDLRRELEAVRTSVQGEVDQTDRARRAEAEVERLQDVVGRRSDLEVEATLRAAVQEELLAVRNEMKALVIEIERHAQENAGISRELSSLARHAVEVTG